MVAARISRYRNCEMDRTTLQHLAELRLRDAEALLAAGQWEAGARLTQKLDESGLPIQVGMWFFMPEINEWRLLYASPEVLERGSRVVYEQIHEARKALGPPSRNMSYYRPLAYCVQTTNLSGRSG